jgi:hypothetical protein
MVTKCQESVDGRIFNTMTLSSLQPNVGRGSKRAAKEPTVTEDQKQERRGEPLSSE